MIRRIHCLFLGLIATAGLMPLRATATCPSSPDTLPHGVEAYDSTSPPIDWAAHAQAGDAFGFVKATQGDYNKQATFAANWASMKQAGLIRAAYHFFDPTVDGVAQADWYVDTVNAAGGFGPGTLAMLDIECPANLGNGSLDPNCLGPGAGTGHEPAAVIKQRAHDFLNRVESRTGKRPYLYTWVGWFYDAGLTEQDFAGYDLDVPSWNNACYSGSSVLNTVFWQYNWVQSRAEGYDRFIGTVDQLRVLAGIAPASLSSNDAIGAVTWPDGHTEVFARSSNGALLQASKVAGAWHMSTNVAAPIECGFAPVIRGGGPIVYCENGGAAESTSWSLSGLSWGSPVNLGGMPGGRPRVLAYPNGALEIVQRSTDGTIALGTVTNGSVTWSSLGGTFASDPTTLATSDGIGRVFAVDPAGHVSVAERGAKTAPFTPIAGAIASKAVPAMTAKQVLLLVARDALGHLEAARFEGSAWSEFVPIDSSTSVQGDPAVVALDDGFEIFARTADGHVVEIDGDGTKWSSVAAVEGQTVASDPFAFREADGSIELFAVDGSRALVRASQSNGAWSAWSTIASGVDACATPPTPSPSTSTATSTGAGAGSATTSGSGGGGLQGTGSGAGCSCMMATNHDEKPLLALGLGAAVVLIRGRRRKGSARSIRPHSTREL